MKGKAKQNKPIIYAQHVPFGSLLGRTQNDNGNSTQ
jgi:hypothetical protein